MRHQFSRIFPEQQKNDRRVLYIKTIGLVAFAFVK